MQHLRGSFEQKLLTTQPTKPSVLVSKRVPSRRSPKVTRISWKTPNINAAGAHSGGGHLQSTTQHLQAPSTPNNLGCLHSPGSGGGCSVGVPRVTDSRLAAQEPGTAHKQLLLPQGTLARPTRSGPSGYLRKAKDAD